MIWQYCSCNVNNIFITNMKVLEINSHIERDFYISLLVKLLMKHFSFTQEI